MAQTLDNQIAKARQRVADQRKWIDKCGGSLGGYLLRYGAADDPNKHGDGGQAIWDADSNELKQLEAELAALVERQAARKGRKS